MHEPNRYNGEVKVKQLKGSSPNWKARAAQLAVVYLSTHAFTCLLHEIIKCITDPYIFYRLHRIYRIMSSILKCTV